MNDYCSICSKKETISDWADGTTFKNVEDKTYCVKCFDDIEDSIICCERCGNFEHINENFDETFVKSLDNNSNVIYYHIKCLFETEKCPICKDYLHLFESPTKLADLSEEGSRSFNEMVTLKRTSKFATFELSVPTNSVPKATVAVKAEVGAEKTGDKKLPTKSATKALEMRNGVKNKECIYVFGGLWIDGCQIEYHKSCVEDKNNVFKFDICRECGISLQVKCESCERRFADCYNEDCKTYGYAHETGRYDGNCSNCNW